MSVEIPKKSKGRKETFEVVSDRCNSRVFCLAERWKPMLKKTSQQELLRNTMEGSILYRFLMFPKFIGIECRIQPRKSDCSVGVKSKLLLEIKKLYYLREIQFSL